MSDREEGLRALFEERIARRNAEASLEQEREHQAAEKAAARR
jgi:hypothetical protein